MTDDLVNRLRSLAGRTVDLPTHFEMTEAAERIEELQAALQYILKVPKSEAAYHVIRVFARTALEGKKDD